MNIPTCFSTPRAILAFATIFALALPGLAGAVGIGEIVLQSRLGEPLLAQVDVTTTRDERIDDACLSLAAPDQSEEDSSNYLTIANLSFKTEGRRQYVAISSRNLFNDAFAKLRLRINCQGTGNVIKTFTILPDLDVSALPARTDIPSAAENTLTPTPAANQIHTRNTQPELKKTSGQMAPSGNKLRPSPVRSTDKKSDRAAAFRLKLSGEPLDESRIGKISPEQRAILLARQKLLDADDQTASFLAMQQQVKQLQDELGEIKLQLAQLGASPATAASSATPSITPATTKNAATENRPLPALAAKPPLLQADNSHLRNGWPVALGLVSTILALGLGLRYYSKIKTPNESRSQPRATPLKPVDVAAAAPKIAPLPIAARHQAAASSPARSDHAPAVVATPKASTFMHEVATPPLQKIKEEVTEEDSMLEEAGLYATHGRPSKAVEILQEIIKRHPAKAEAWPLLLSIYSSLGKATEFEKTAREFLRHHKNSPSWSGIQALGRTFDQHNPLYADRNNRIAAAPLLPGTTESHQPIGDILMEMGVLSKQDLQNCLDDFNPKKHGRFGGYLVARKAITLAQLDQALLQQQGINTEVQPGPLPSLQDMENFLADFDPKRDGSVGEFLASRKAVTPEQLSQLLQPHANQEEAAETSAAQEPALVNHASAADFVLDSAPKKIIPPDLEFESLTEKEELFEFDWDHPHSPPEKQT